MTAHASDRIWSLSRTPIGVSQKNRGEMNLLNGYFIMDVDENIQLVTEWKMVSMKVTKGVYP